MRAVLFVCLTASDDTMFCLSAKAMRLWRDVCLWHVADKSCHCERSVAISRKGILFKKTTQDTFVLAWRKSAVCAARLLFKHVKRLKETFKAVIHKILYLGKVNVDCVQRGFFRDCELTVS